MLFNFNKKSSIQNTCKLDLIKFDPNPFALHVCTVHSINYLPQGQPEEWDQEKQEEEV